MLDLAVLNIDRGRDHGLPSYNVLRAAFGLRVKPSFKEIDPNVPFEAAYGKTARGADNVDAIDPWIGALAEPHVPGANVGELIRAAMVAQFRMSLPPLHQVAQMRADSTFSKLPLDRLPANRCKAFGCDQEEYIL